MFRKLLFSVAVIAAPVQAQDARPWSLSFSGGTTSSGDEGDQPFMAASLTRYFGAGYLRGGVTFIDSDEGEGLATAFIPAETTQFTLGGGYRFGRATLDIYGMIGDRSFDEATVRRRIGDLSFDSDGSIAGAGASLTFEAAIDDVWIAPFAALDYSKIDQLLTVRGPRGGTLVTDEQQEDGFTASGGATAGIGFGPARAHSFGLYGAFVTTSNAASVIREGPLAAVAPRLLGGGDSSDSWLEYGATASLGLSPALALDISGVRTAGLDPSETTSLSAAVRLAF